MCETLICCCPVQVSEGARSQTRTVFVGQTASGEFFAMCACVVLQVRGARGPTQDSGAEEPGTLRACEGGRGLVTTTHHAVTQTTIQRETEEKKETEKKDRKKQPRQNDPEEARHLPPSLCSSEAGQSFTSATVSGYVAKRKNPP